MEDYSPFLKVLTREDGETWHLFYVAGLAFNKIENTFSSLWWAPSFLYFYRLLIPFYIREHQSALPINPSAFDKHLPKGSFPCLKGKLQWWVFQTWREALSCQLARRHFSADGPAGIFLITLRWHVPYEYANISLLDIKDPFELNHASNLRVEFLLELIIILKLTFSKRKICMFGFALFQQLLVPIFYV